MGNGAVNSQNHARTVQVAPGMHVRRIRAYGMVMGVFWTLVVACSFAWFYNLHIRDIEKIARAEATAAFERDMLFRRWASHYGGVYVPVSEHSPPNPYLVHVSERDITTPSGRNLTLINPAYMLRQMYDMAEEQQLSGRGHITSLKPLRPENRPDPWEEQALHAFERGVEEVAGVQTIAGKSYQRIMRPFITEASCLKCHAGQGYREGDVRGGISISMPLRSLQEATHFQVIGVGGAHGLLWLLGAGMIGFGSRKLCLSADAVQRQTILLEDEVAERQSAQETLQEQALVLEEEIAERQLVQEELALSKKRLEEVNCLLEERVEAALDELRRKDQLLIQQNRLAAMGEMIHNIAHQWRQPLNNVGLIIQNLWLSAESGRLDTAEMKKDINGAMDIIMHMSSTIDDFRNFFRPDREKRDFAISRVLASSLEFMAAALENSSIRVEVTADDTVIANGYQNEYGQALLNILDNARDVLIERKPADPLITIHVAQEGGRSVLTVRDNGGGIADDVLSRVFDPYFTTKGPNRGTGIGLYMAKVIIEQHMGGHLSAYNVDGGAEFRIEV